MPKSKPPKSALVRSVGARLREIRLLRKVSQQRVAEAVGLSQGSLSLYESGARDISVVNLLTILDELEVSVVEFFAGVPAFAVLKDSDDIGIATKLITHGLGSPTE